MSRREFSRKTRILVFARSGGRCEACSAKLKVGEGEVDHILPCVLGGGDEPDNARLLCKVCHRAKSAADIKGVRKADRARDKQSGAIDRRTKITSRGFEPPPPQRSATRELMKQLPPRRWP